MILPDHEIIKLCEPEPKKEFTGEFEGGDLYRTITARPLVEPFTISQVEPASYDVRLGNEFMVFERDDTPYIDMADPKDITKKVIRDDMFMLHPGEFILGRTVEVLSMPANLTARIEGKSSIGRLGLMAHVTAGYIDPGFIGTVTLEMACLHPLPVMLRPGQLIAQISFHEMKSPAKQPYRGRYQHAEGVESSKFGQREGDK